MKILSLDVSGYAGSYIKKVLEKNLNLIIGTYKTFRSHYSNDNSMV